MENKVIFENEEEARKLFIDIGITEMIDYAVEQAKKHGYIRKTAIEEAEEIISEMGQYMLNYEDSESVKLFGNQIRNLYNGWQELKAENERLKK